VGTSKLVWVLTEKSEFMKRLISKIRSWGITGAILCLLGVPAVLADSPIPDVAKILPPKVGSFIQVGPIRPFDSLRFGSNSQKLIDPSPIRGEATYVSTKGERYSVQVLQLRRDADAYSFLTGFGKVVRENTSEPGQITQKDVGTATIRTHDDIAFFKGTHFVRVSPAVHAKDLSSLIELARQIADTLSGGDGDIPPLVKHLPGGDAVQNKAVFISGLTTLDSPTSKRLVLNALNGMGDADLVSAKVGPSEVTIVEFNTPQLATENDQRIIAKVHELWNTGQAAPTAYRRVGNYSVFVFDAPNEEIAKQLIDEVKYEQVVQWLGDNPNILKDAQKRYVETTMGVFVAVVKASGVALVACFGSGALFGALLFMRRRKQQREVEAFSDAGGMLRLNLDELTNPEEQVRLLRS
jgi:uncharacterized protein DUF6599